MKDTKILTVTGPSGCGKTSFVNHLQKFFGSEVDVLVSATTRPQRPHELDGRDYYFLSREEFEKKDFLEKVDFHDNLYGLEISEIEKKLDGNSKLLLVIVEKKGAYEIRRAYSGRVLNLLIGISPERSRKRLVRRDGEEKAIQRMEADKISGLDSLNYFSNDEGFFWDFYFENVSTKQNLRKKSHLIADLAMGFLPPAYFDYEKEGDSQFLKKDEFRDFSSKFKQPIHFLPMSRFSKSGIWFADSVLPKFYERT